MSKRKKKVESAVKLNRKGQPIPQYILKARTLKKNLTQRVSLQSLKETTPTIRQLENWCNHEHFICVYCYRELTLDEMTCEHLLPLARLGDNSIENLAYSCLECNQMKGNLTDEEFRSLLELIKTWHQDGQAILLKKLKQSNAIFGRK